MDSTNRRRWSQRTTTSILHKRLKGLEHRDPVPSDGSADLTAYIRGLCYRSAFFLLAPPRGASEAENPLERSKSLRFLVVSFRSFYLVRYLWHERSLVISVSILRRSFGSNERTKVNSAQQGNIYPFRKYLLRLFGRWTKPKLYPTSPTSGRANETKSP